MMVLPPLVGCGPNDPVGLARRARYTTCLQAGGVSTNTIVGINNGIIVINNGIVSNNTIISENNTVFSVNNTEITKIKHKSCKMGLVKITFLGKMGS